MKVQTEEDLSNSLISELSWRRKEISDLSLLIKASSDAHRNMLLRGGIALIYAHWEGFTKRACRRYLEFVSIRRLPNEELVPGFLYATYQRQLRIAAEAKKDGPLVACFKSIFSDLKNPSRIPTEEVINTRSNLSIETLVDILELLGLDASPYVKLQHLIDDRLLNFRNKIAHGEEMAPDPDDFEEIKVKVLGLMVQIKDQIEDAAKNRLYRKELG